jgi:hypothetical protein
MIKMDWLDDCNESEACSVGEGFGNAFAGIGLGLTALVQAGGLALIIVGAATRSERVVPIYALAPMAVDGGGGLTARGTF